MAEDGECRVGVLPEYCGRGVKTGFCMVEDFLTQAAHPTRDLLLNRYTLIAGLLMTLQFHVMPIVAYACEEDTISKAKEGRTRFVVALLDAWARVAPVARNAIRVTFGPTRSWHFARCLGRNIIVLSIYYSKIIEDAERSLLPSDTHQPFIESVIFVLFEVLMNRAARQLQKNKLKNYSVGEDEDWWKHEKVIDSKFSDFSVPCRETTILFVAQFSLFLIFVLDMNGDGKTHDRSCMNVFHWLVAVLVTNVAGLQESGEGFHRSVWDKMWEDPPDVRGAENIKGHCVQFWIRCGYAAIINGFCRELLLCLAPVAMCVANRDELVKDCLAIFFISQMDDIEPKRMDESLMGWDKRKELKKMELRSMRTQFPADDREEHENSEPKGRELEEGLLQNRVKVGLEDRIRQLEEKLKRLDRDGDNSTAAETSRRSTNSRVGLG